MLEAPEAELDLVKEKLPQMMAVVDDRISGFCFCGNDGICYPSKNQNKQIRTV